MAECPFCKEALHGGMKPGQNRVLRACTACKNPYIVVREGAALATHPIDTVQDVREMAPEGSIGGDLLAELPEAMKRLPMLPEVSQRVLSMVRDPEASMQDLANLIREDQVISLAVMRLANSPVYGGLSEITELNTACARLGMKTIANTVQAVANRNLFITGDQRLRTFMQQLWRHAIATAYCAEEVARIRAEPNTDLLFLGGLLHDVGKVALLEIVTNARSGALSALRDNPDLLREVLDGFHTLAGLHVVQAWGLPPEFHMLTFCHEDPALCFDEGILDRVHIVALANVVAKAEGFTVYDQAEDTMLIGHPSTRHLNLGDVKLASLRVDLTDRLESIIQALSQPAS
ncbi:MAG: HDOD domain-containing protein [Candidatus Hydrogenedentota bacterium]